MLMYFLCAPIATIDSPREILLHNNIKNVLRLKLRDFEIYKEQVSKTQAC